MTATTPIPAAPAAPATTTTTGNHPLIGIDPATLTTWLTDPGTVVVDVRETFEHALDHIHGSHLRPLSTFDPEAVRAEFAGKRVVFYCRSGRRSADAGNRYRFCTGGSEPVYHLEGGITAWHAAALPVDRLATRPPMDVMRQTQISMGTFVLLFTALGAFVSPWLLLGTAVVGGGMVYAGASGSCAMANLIALLPWNRVPAGMTACAACNE
ncbi:MAG: rhodanese-like domain-containing protein [Planctomycetota bacterium]